MRRLSLWLCGMTLFAGLVPVAFPQAAELSVHGGGINVSNGNIGSVSDITSGIDNAAVNIKGNFRIGFRLTLNNYRFFGHEFGYAYNRVKIRYDIPQVPEQGFAAHQGFYNFLGYALPEGTPVRPFLTGGVQFTNFTPPGTSALQGGGSTKFGVNYGGGVKVKVSSLFMVRGDVRQYLSPKPFDFFGKSGWLRLNEYSVGFGIVL